MAVVYCEHCGTGPTCVVCGRGLTVTGQRVKVIAGPNVGRVGEVVRVLRDGRYPVVVEFPPPRKGEGGDKAGSWASYADAELCGV